MSDLLCFGDSWHLDMSFALHLVGDTGELGKKILNLKTIHFHLYWYMVNVSAKFIN